MRLEKKVVEKVWGSEEWIVNTESYCGKILNLRGSYQSSLHYHRVKNETFYVLSGKVLLEIDGERVIMDQGDIQLIKPNQPHRFTGLEESEIIEFATHHEESDSYRPNDKSRKINLNEFLTEGEKTYLKF